MSTLDGLAIGALVFGAIYVTAWVVALLGGD